MQWRGALFLFLSTSGCELFLSPREQLEGRDGGGDSSDGGVATCDADITHDEKNCGACGRDCCEGKCVSGACTPAQLGLGGEPRSLTLDDTSIYWFDRSDGTIRGRPKSQVGQEKVIYTGTSGLNIGQIAVDGTSVYFTSATAVMRAPKIPGTATTIRGGLTNAGSAAVHDGFVYYVTGSEVRRVRFDGSGDELITTLANAGPALVVAPPSLYLTPKLVRVPLLGGSQEGPAFDTDAVSVGPNDVFALQFLPTTRVAVVRLDLATLTPTTITEVDGAGGIAADGARVWLGDFGTTNGDGAIVRYDTDGKNRTVLATGMPRPSYLVADERCIYWSNPYNDGRIMKVAK